MSDKVAKEDSSRLSGSTDTDGGRGWHDEPRLIISPTAAASLPEKGRQTTAGLRNLYPHTMPQLDWAVWS